ncbi:MAG: sugar transferase [Ruminococcus sp.]|nr:sugar transferase [Ruminococcus sp.]
MFTLAFSEVWNNSYNEVMEDPFWKNGNILLVLIYAALYVFISSFFGAFHLGYYTELSLIGSQVIGTLGTNTISFVIISLIGRGRLSVKPMIYLTIYEFFILVLWVYVFSALFARLYPPRRMVVIYGNKNAADLIRKMGKRGDKYVICEAVSCDERFDEIIERINEYDAVIINDIPHELRSEILKYCLEKSIRVYINPKISDIIIRGADDFNMFDTPLLLNRNSGLKFEQKLMKRTLDLVMALLGFIIASPFMLVTAIAIKAYDGGPILYKQKRLTTGGKRFYVYKFRSMIVGAEKKSGAVLAKENDDRITPIGKIIRKIRFDELPQLLNIIKGDMSFVGPRPERPEIARKYEETMPEFKYRLKTKAGLTGYAQVMGKYNTTPYDKLKMDLMYIERQSLLLDLRIMLMTVKIVFTPSATEGVKEGSKGKKKK